MDIKDFEAGLTEEGFWFQGKINLIQDLLKKCAPPANANILNIGAGTGGDLKIINKFGRLFVLDKDQNVLNMIPDNLAFEKKAGDAVILPYPNGFFDIVLLFDVLEHIKEDDKCVKEIHRVLNGEGRVIFTIPAFNFLFSSHDKALNHERRYSKKRISRLFRNFHKLHGGYWNCFLFIPVGILRILRKNSPSKIHNL